MDPFAVDPSNPDEVLAEQLAAIPFDLIDRLIAIRDLRKMTQEDVARRMNRHVSQVSRFENAEDPKLSTVIRYAYAVGARIETPHPVPADLPDIPPAKAATQTDWQFTPVRKDIPTPFTVSWEGDQWPQSSSKPATYLLETYASTPD